jgi:cell division septation protein DedD
MLFIILYLWTRKLKLLLFKSKSPQKYIIDHLPSNGQTGNLTFRMTFRMQFDIGRLGGGPMQTENPRESKKTPFFRGGLVAAVILAVAFGVYIGLVRMYPAQTTTHTVARGKIPPMPPPPATQPEPGPSNPSMPSDTLPPTSKSGNDSTSPDQSPRGAEPSISMDAGDNGIRATASHEPEIPPASTATMAPDQPAKEETPSQTTPAHSDSSPQEFESAGIYTVQVGAYRTKNNADRQVAKLREKGLDAYLFQLDKKNQQPWYLVRIGHFESLDAADQALVSFRQREKMEGAIKRLKSN